MTISKVQNGSVKHQKKLPTHSTTIQSYSLLLLAYTYTQKRACIQSTSTVKKVQHKTRWEKREGKKLIEHYKKLDTARQIHKKGGTIKQYNLSLRNTSEGLSPWQYYWQADSVQRHILSELQ